MDNSKVEYKNQPIYWVTLKMVNPSNELTYIERAQNMCGQLYSKKRWPLLYFQFEWHKSLNSLFPLPIFYEMINLHIMPHIGMLNGGLSKSTAIFFMMLHNQYGLPYGWIYLWNNNISLKTFQFYFVGTNFLHKSISWTTLFEVLERFFLCHTWNTTKICMSFTLATSILLCSYVCLDMV